jgi:N-acetylglutamate synthase-like GNAT family acetyltransferase
VTPAVVLRPAGEEDFEPLLDLSVRVLRADLERLDRFMLSRRRARMRAVFDAGELRVIEQDGQRAGCIGLACGANHLVLHSVYLEPALQGRGLGAAAVAAALDGAPALPVRIEVLRDSRAHRFWERLGFLRVGEDGVDWLYERPAGLGAARPPA